MSKITFMFNDNEIDWLTFRTIIKQSPMYKDLQDKCIEDLMRPSEAISLNPNSFNNVFNAWLFQFVANDGLSNVSVRIEDNADNAEDAANESDNNTAK